jgi:hypothetical protein
MVVENSELNPTLPVMTPAASRSGGHLALGETAEHGGEDLQPETGAII